MKRFFIVLTGIYMLLLALLSGALGVSGFMVPPEIQQTQSASPVTVLCVFAPIMIWLAATGIGLFMSKNWARLSILVMSGLALFTGLTTMAVIGFMPFPDTGLEPAAVGMIKAGIVGVVGFFLVFLPVIYGVFFTRKSVKSIFGTLGEKRTESFRPVGITILALFTLFGAIGGLFSLFISGTQGIPFFGITLTGTVMQGYMILISGINLYLGYGFWKLKKSAWLTGVAIYVFGIAHTVFNILFADVEDFTAAMPSENAAYAMNPVFFKGMLLSSAIFAGFLLWYLVSKKALFYKDREMEIVTDDHA